MPDRTANRIDKCRHCAMILPPKASKCPLCGLSIEQGAPVREEKRGHGLLYWIAFGLVYRKIWKMWEKTLGRDAYM